MRVTLACRYADRMRPHMRCAKMPPRDVLSDHAGLGALPIEDKSEVNGASATAVGPFVRYCSGAATWLPSATSQLTSSAPPRAHNKQLSAPMEETGGATKNTARRRPLPFEPPSITTVVAPPSSQASPPSLLPSLFPNPVSQLAGAGRCHPSQVRCGLPNCGRFLTVVFVCSGCSAPVTLNHCTLLPRRSLPRGATTIAMCLHAPCGLTLPPNNFFRSPPHPFPLPQGAFFRVPAMACAALLLQCFILFGLVKRTRCFLDSASSGWCWILYVYLACTSCVECNLEFISCSHLCCFRLLCA